jgi:hypothetical protein
MHTYLLSRIDDLSKLPAWGNARDIETLAKSMVRKAFAHATGEADPIILLPEDGRNCIESMLAKCRDRVSDQLAPQPSFSGQQQASDAPRSAPQVNSSTSTTTKTDLSSEKAQEPNVLDDDGRDPGVSDAVWQKLQKDKKLADWTAEATQQAIRKGEEAHARAQEAEKKAEANSAAALELEEKNQADSDELLRKQEEARILGIEAEAEEAREEARKAAAALLERHAAMLLRAQALLRKREEARIREAEAKAERERIQKAIERMKQEEMKRRQKEEKAQVKLRQMGICPMGFRWIKQAGGYRCSAGGHWVSDSILGL